MNQRARGRNRLLAGTLCCCCILLILLTAMAKTTYPYETTCAENVNLRKTASGSATILLRIQAGETVKVLGETKDYYQLESGGKTGYAMKQYVDGTSTGPEIPPVMSGYEPPTAVTKYPYDTNTIAKVKFRKTADDMATILSVIPQDAVVKVLGVETNGYAKIKYDGKTGYVNSGFINLANIPTPSPVPTATPDPDADKYTLLERGSEGLHVRALQEALSEMTYYQGTVDSKYGEQTKTAVNAFKKKNGMPEDGVADGAMQKLLYEGKPKDPKGYRKIIKTLPPVGEVVISSGKKGEQVETLQARLKELGYYLGEINGVCDKATVRAIEDFQQKHSIKKTGTADLETQRVLYGATALFAAAIVTPEPVPTVAPPKDTVRAGDKGDDAKAVQQRLKDLGYYKGKVDGKFTSTSVKALEAFQEKSGLKKDGVCGAQTRSALWGDDAVYAVATAMPIEVVSTMAPLTPETTMIIQAGSRGNAVLNLQIRLSELGYYASRQDGVCLEDDISAIRAFQKANGLKVDGKAGYQTQSALYSAEVIANSTVAIGEALRYGSRGDAVVALQNRLIELGYLTGSADGAFGFATKTALMAFQKANQLARDGVAGAQTQAALASLDAAKQTVSATDILREGSVSSAVKDLQSRLIALGYLTGSADGKFGAKTSVALIAFQQRNNLVADGVAGVKTFERINSANVKQAVGAAPTPVPGAILLPGAPQAADVRYANWYTEVKARCKVYPNVTVYDFVTGISWQVNIFSMGAHADGEPLTANDTANMNRAFGGVTTWTPKAVWVVLSDGSVYMASTHNTPHETSHIFGNNFDGHLCIHFPRTMAQVEAIGPYATSHQKAIDLGWQATQSMARRQQ